MSATLTQERDTAVKSARELIAKVKADGRDLTDEENTQLEGWKKSVQEIDAKAARAKQHGEYLAVFGDAGDSTTGDGAGQDVMDSAGSLGEHFVKHAGDRFKAVRGTSGATVSAPEYKAATDFQGTTGSVFSPVLTQVDRTIVQAVRPRLTIADLCGSGTISGNAVTYFVEGAVEGGFATVAEGAAKPQMHFVDPTTVTDSLKKIAAFFKLTDEMTDDLDFIVSEINQRGLYLLGNFEEQQLLAGNGSGTNLTGILNRSGIQTEARGNLASNDTAADTAFRAMTKVRTGSGLEPDGIAIHPLDYQQLRLSKDGNGQYYGGGYFTGEYGVGGILQQPPLWGLRTVVTPAITQGTALVGAFGQAATVYRKGGVRVESTNSHASDFTNNLVTVRIEERVALAVRVPSGFVKTTLTVAP